MSYRILVTGSPDWDDEQELRLVLIKATYTRAPSVVIVHEADTPGTMATRWASDYGVRTEPPSDATPDACLAFGDSPAADEAEHAGVRVQRYERSGCA